MSMQLKTIKLCKIIEVMSNGMAVWGKKEIDD